MKKSELLAAMLEAREELVARLLMTAESAASSLVARELRQVAKEVSGGGGSHE